MDRFEVNKYPSGNPMGNFFGYNTNEKKSHNRRNCAYNYSYDCLDRHTNITSKHITYSGYKVVYIYSIIHSIIDRFICRFDSKLVFCEIGHSFAYFFVVYRSCPTITGEYVKKF